MSVYVAYTNGRSAKELGIANDKLENANKNLKDEQDHLKEEQKNTEKALGKFRRLSVLLAVERAGAFVEHQEPNRALLWLTRALKDAPREDEDLQFLLRTNLACLRPLPPVPSAPQRPSVGIRQLATSPDGKMVLREPFNKPPQLEEAITEKVLAELPTFKGYLMHAQFSPDGKRLAAVATINEGNTRKSELLLWDVATSKPLRKILEFPTFINDLAFSPDGQRLLTTHADGVARLLDAATGELLGTELKNPEKTQLNQFQIFIRARFSADGKSIVTFGGKAAHLWDATTGKPRGEPLNHQDVINQAEFSPNSRILATISNDKTARLWDVATGKATATLLHRYPVTLVAFSPDEQVLATGDGLHSYQPGGPTSEVRLWTMQGQSLPQPIQPEEELNSLIFSPDGRALLIAARRFTLVADVRTGSALLKPIVQPEELGATQSSFNRDGFRVVTRSGIHEIPEYLALPRILLHRDVVSMLTFSPDGKRILTGTRSGRAEGGPRYAYQWDVADGQSLGQPMQQADGVTVVAYSPDGKLILTGGGAWDGTARLWDAETGQPHGQPLEYGFGSQIQVGAFSRDGKTVLLGGYAKEHQQTARMWDVATGQPVGTALMHKEEVKTLAYSPDGKMIVTGSADQTAQRWDAASGKPLGSPLKHQAKVESVAFSLDGRQILTASLDRTARVWDAASGELILTLRHDDGVVRAMFSPNGQIILTASMDKTVRLWDAVSGKPVGLPWQHDDRVLCAAFSPDGRIVATGCADGKARFWAAETGMRVGPLLAHPRPVKAIAYSPLGTCIVTTCEDRAARIWDAPAALTGSTEQLASWVEAETGQELDDAGAVHVLKADVIAQRRSRLAELGGPPPQAIEGPDQLAARHLRVAQDAAENGQWFAAAWHLDRVLAQQPADWSALLLRGQAYLQLGQRERAAADYELAFRIGPAPRVLAACNMQIEEFERGNEFVRDEPVKQNNWQTVVWYLDRMIATWPNDWRLYDRRGRAYLELNQPVQADADYERALAFNPDLSFFYRTLGPANGEAGWAMYHAQRRDWGRAAVDFSRAVELGSDSLTVWSYHALLRLHFGDQAGFQRACVNFVSQHKDSWYSGRTSILVGLCSLGPDSVKDLDRLVRLADNAAQETANGRFTLLNMGDILYRSGRLEEAVHCLQEGLPSPNCTADDWVMLALAHERLGHHTEAKKWRDKAAAWVEEQNKQPPPGGGQIRYVNPQALLATMVLLDEFDHLQERDEKTLAELTRCIQARPEDPESRVARGWFHANRGQWEAALKDFSKAIDLHPKDARLWMHRARCHARMSNIESASADFSKATQLRPEDMELRLECARARVDCRDWNGAALDFAELTQARPKDTDLRIECGQAQAAAGLWDRAIADFTRVTEERPADAWNWYYLALANLGAGNRPAYKRTCLEMKERFGNSPKPSELQRLLYACVVTPDGLPDLAAFTETVRRYGMMGRPWSRPIGGAFLYRTGQYNEASKRLESIHIDRPPRLIPWDYLFLAMAYYHQSDAKRANENLRKAVEWIEAADRQQGGSLGQTRPGWDQWRERLMAHILRRETEALLKGDSPATPK
jgi:WD40 repeat protein/tetratricopeptide (TPR) repeat protein